MVHATDYANMTFNQLRNKLESTIEKDAYVKKSVQYVFPTNNYFYFFP